MTKSQNSKIASIEGRVSKKRIKFSKETHNDNTQVLFEKDLEDRMNNDMINYVSIYSHHLSNSAGEKLKEILEDEKYNKLNDITISNLLSYAEKHQNKALTLVIKECRDQYNDLNMNYGNKQNIIGIAVSYIVSIIINQYIYQLPQELLKNHDFSFDTLMKENKKFRNDFEFDVNYVIEKVIQLIDKIMKE